MHFRLGSGNNQLVIVLLLSRALYLCSEYGNKHFPSTLALSHSLCFPLYSPFLIMAGGLFSDVSKIHKLSCLVHFRSRCIEHEISLWTEPGEAAGNTGCNLAHLDCVRLLYIEAKLFITIQGLLSQTLFCPLGNCKQEALGSACKIHSLSLLYHKKKMDTI